MLGVFLQALFSLKSIFGEAFMQDFLLTPSRTMVGFSATLR
jgi:hypothetical protein